MQKFTPKYVLKMRYFLIIKDRRSAGAELPTPRWLPASGPAPDSVFVTLCCQTHCTFIIAQSG